MDVTGEVGRLANGTYLYRIIATNDLKERGGVPRCSTDRPLKIAPLRGACSPLNYPSHAAYQREVVPMPFAFSDHHIEEYRTLGYTVFRQAAYHPRSWLTCDVQATRLGLSRADRMDRKASVCSPSGSLKLTSSPS